MHARATVPHLITASRAVIVAATYPVVLFGDAWLVVAFVLAAVLSDVVDGILARRWGVASSFGANLDSAVDALFYVSVVAWVWMWDSFRFPVIEWPEILPWVAIFLPLYALALILAKLRRGEMGFHNFWGRTAATVGITVALATILWGWQVGYLPLLVGVGAFDLLQRFAQIFRAPSPRRPMLAPKPDPAKR